MKNLIKRILKEEFDNSDWFNDIRQITPAEEFVYNIMSESTLVPSTKIPGWKLYKDKATGEFLMAYAANAKTLAVDKDKIWDVLINNFKLNKEEANDLCVLVFKNIFKEEDVEEARYILSNSIKNFY